MTTKPSDRTTGDPPRSRRRRGAGAHGEDGSRGPVPDPVTWLERKLAALEAELDAARTAGQLKVAVRYYLQVKTALARERAQRAAPEPGRSRTRPRAKAGAQGARAVAIDRLVPER